MSQRDNPEWPRAQFLDTDHGGRMAYRLLGNAAGEPWLVLHGGPGSGSHAAMLRPFDLLGQRVVVPDQRGAGLSSPRGSTRANNTFQLVKDLEQLRQKLGIDRWSILAGSWGTVLALHYAQTFPLAVGKLIMRGAFGLKRAEIEGVLLRQTARLAGTQMPAIWPRACYANASTVLNRLGQVLQVGAPSVATRDAIRFWSRRELAVALQGQGRARRHLALGTDLALVRQAHATWASTHRQLRKTLALANQPAIRVSDRQGWQKFRLQAHYLRHRGYTRPAGLSRAVLSLAQHNLHSTWVHGQFDAICPVGNSQTQVALLQRQAGAQVDAHWPIAGHLGGEPGILQALRHLLAPQGTPTT